MGRAGSHLFGESLSSRGVLYDQSAKISAASLIEETTSKTEKGSGNCGQFRLGQLFHGREGKTRRTSDCGGSGNSPWLSAAGGIGRFHRRDRKAAPSSEAGRSDSTASLEAGSLAVCPRHFNHGQAAENGFLCHGKGAALGVCKGKRHDRAQNDSDLFGFFFNRCESEFLRIAKSNSSGREMV